MSIDTLHSAFVVDRKYNTSYIIIFIYIAIVKYIHLHLYNDEWAGTSGHRRATSAARGHSFAKLITSVNKFCYKNSLGRGYSLFFRRRSAMYRPPHKMRVSGSWNLGWG